MPYGHFRLSASIPTRGESLQVGLRNTMQLITRRRSGLGSLCPVGCQRPPRDIGQPRRRLYRVLSFWPFSALLLQPGLTWSILGPLASQTPSQAESW